MTPVAYGTGEVGADTALGYRAVALVFTLTVNDADPQAMVAVAVSAGLATVTLPDVAAVAPVHVTVYDAMSLAGSALPSVYDVGALQLTFAVVPAASQSPTIASAAIRTIHSLEIFTLPNS